MLLRRINRVMAVAVWAFVIWILITWTMTLSQILFGLGILDCRRSGVCHAGGGGHAMVVSDN